jgi:ergothioneine biosynthesis protein EgtB
MATVTMPFSRRTLIAESFRRVRAASVDMCAPLTPEEYRLQPVEEVSPPWWNLGHTSWFFARNVLAPLGGRRTAEDDAYDYLLNSYYASLGARLPRGKRGSVSRPTTNEILRYRQSVDARVEELLESIDGQHSSELERLLAIGIQHEQQHQELFYTEIKYILAQNPRPLRRAYANLPPEQQVAPPGPAAWIFSDGGLLEFGHRGSGWCWDNELPLHPYYLPPFEIAERLVTCREFLAFVREGGYANPLLWLDNGWREVEAQRLAAPLYWENVDGTRWIWTLSGMKPLALEEPACHVSFYEADAFARWKSATFDEYRGARLPSEREWEHAAQALASEPLASEAFLDSQRLHPAIARATPGLVSQMNGALWQWTSSYYEPYPGYRPFPGALAEYNGKFMDNQRVLRGGSCVTPRDHYRHTYRNFWPAPTRFQFTGIRLARSLED